MAAPYSMGEATFFAFQKREGGPVLAGATAVFLVAMIVLYGGWILLNREGVAAYGELVRSAAQGAEPDPSTILPAMMGMVGSLFLLAPFVGLLFAAYEAACLKRMIRGSAGAGLFGINFGADTWRVFGCYLCWLMVLIGGYIGIFLLAAIGGMAGAVTKSEAFTGLAVLVSVIAALVLWLFVSVRLAPGAAVSIQSGRFSFFDAWGATRGKFWTLFGSFAFLWIIYIVVSSMFQGVLFFALLKPMTGAMTSADPDPAAAMEQMRAMWKAMATPGNIALFGGLYLAMVIVGMIAGITGFGINAKAALAAAEEPAAA